MVGANGKERDTTLRDAKKLNLIPSVTTILKGVLAAPGLENWKSANLVKLALHIAADRPIGIGESLDEWVDAIVKEARQDFAISGEQRMGFGTLVHDSLEKLLMGQELDIEDVKTPSGEIHPISTFTNPVMELFADNGWKANDMEEVVVGPGYAGTADVQYTAENEYGIIDLKTTKDATKPFPAIDHVVQIAMYHYAVHGGFSEKAAGYNIYISSERNIGAVKAVRYPAEKLLQAFDFGMLLVDAWQYINGYTPRQDRNE